MHSYDSLSAAIGNKSVCVYVMKCVFYLKSVHVFNKCVLAAKLRWTRWESLR